MAKEDKSQWFSPMQQLIGDVDKQEIMEGNLKNILDMDNHKIIEGDLNLDVNTVIQISRRLLRGIEILM